MLAIQFDAIDATEWYIVLAKNGQEIGDALLVGLVALLESFPPQCLGGLAAEFELELNERDKEKVISVVIR